MPIAAFHNADVIQGLADLPDNYFDGVLCDPPYGLSSTKSKKATRGFMGLGWDAGVPDAACWAAVKRVCKPGAYLLAFGGTRTYHRLACAIEDAGWVIRDCVMWVYGSGFPKSHNISKAIDKKLGVERKVVGKRKMTGTARKSNLPGHGCTVSSASLPREYVETEIPVTVAGSAEARQWEGYGTALKPAWEPIIIAQKPIEGTYVENCLCYGCGGLNIDGTRVPTDDKYSYPNGPGGKSHHYSSDKRLAEVRPNPTASHDEGRWPANVIHDGSKEVIVEFPTKAGGGYTKSWGNPDGNGIYGTQFPRGDGKLYGYGDEGSASRFFKKIEHDGRWPSNLVHDGSDGVIGCFPDAPGQQGALTGNEPSGVMGATNCFGKMDRRHQAIPRNDSGSAARFFKEIEPDARHIVVAQKPIEGTYVDNCLQHGCGCLNIDGTRVPANGESVPINTWDDGAKPFGGGAGHAFTTRQNSDGRWPSNLVHDGSDGVKGNFPATKPSKKGKPRKGKKGNGWGMSATGAEYDDSGTAARFFYCAKANKKDRGEGNTHPTCKPTALCEYLAKLILPPDTGQHRRLLVPFCGSGSEMIGALSAGWEDVHGIEQDASWAQIVYARIRDRLPDVVFGDSTVFASARAVVRVHAMEVFDV